MENKTLRSNGSICGQGHAHETLQEHSAVSLSCDINTGKKQ